MAVTSSIPVVIDWLVTNITGLPECADATVSDGWPEETGKTAGVTIGVTPDDTGSEWAAQPAQLGAQRYDEDYSIPVIVWAWVGGTSDKKPRDAAFSIFNAVLNLIRGNMTLGGLLNSHTAEVTPAAIRPTRDARQAGEGRRCEIHFYVHCRNRF